MLQVIRWCCLIFSSAFIYVLLEGQPLSTFTFWYCYASIWFYIGVFVWTFKIKKEFTE